MKRRSAFWRAAAIFGAALLSGAFFFPATASAKLKTLHSFCRYFGDSGCRDGGSGFSLVMDQAGNLFGTAGAGARNGGIVFGLLHEAGSSGLKYKVLRNFCADLDCADGANPGPLIIDSAGNLYGVARSGGAHNAGVFFELAPRGGTRWKYTVPYSFCGGPSGGCADGGEPIGKLTYAGAEKGQPYDGVSPLYGGAWTGGKYAEGTMYSLGRVNGGWRAKSIYDFCKDPACPDGRDPDSLLPDGRGNLVGTTHYGGNAVDQYGDTGGVAFRLTPSSIHPNWDQTVLYRFCSQANCADGYDPSGIAVDISGNVFGTTESGALCSGTCGVIYEITSGGTESTLYRFCSQPNCTDGEFPDGPLLIGSDGSLFGTAYRGGEFGYGTLFKWSSGTFEVRYAFCRQANCADGANPAGGLLMDSSGSLFGTTEYGGAHNYGTVFRLTR